jgi:hypothetical protein
LTRHGDYAGGDPASLQFNFYANADGSGHGAPDNLGFYFRGNGHVWYYDIDSTYVQDGNNVFRAQLDYNTDAYGSTAWYGYTDNSWGAITTETDFLSDIQNVDRVGIWIAYNAANSTQDHQITLYGISVPEPETYLILGMALLSVAIVFRKRISESLAEARSMMRT